MKSIALTAMKGGVGKTTLAVHLAVAAMRAGETVAIIDTDPQASAAAWARVRNGGSPDVVPVPVERLAQALAAAADDYTVVIVDTAPRASTEAATVCGAVDIAVIPTRPSAVDLETLEQSVRIVQAAKCEGLVVLNACPARAPEIAEARGYAASLGLPSQRSRSANAGHSLEPLPKVPASLNASVAPPPMRCPRFGARSRPS